MHLSRACDYALRAMMYLAELPAGSVVARSRIAEATGAPEPFLAKVLAALVRARLVTSRPGASGGFGLARAADRISMLAVVEAIDGKEFSNLCSVENVPCDRRRWCSVHRIVENLRVQAVRSFRSTSIAALAVESSGRAKAPLVVIRP